MPCTNNNPNNYHTFHQTWTNPMSKEKFFVSYAVRGPTVLPQYALQQDMPVNHPICGPVKEPSPLNTRYQYSPTEPCNGIQ